MGPDGKELPKDDHGQYIGTGTQKIDVTHTEATADPLMNEDGTPVEGRTPADAIRLVKEHFAEEADTEVLSVVILETRPVREIPGAEFAKL